MCAGVESRSSRSPTNGKQGGAKGREAGKAPVIVKFRFV